MIYEIRYTIPGLEIGYFKFPAGNEILEVVPNCWITEDQGKFALVIESNQIGHDVIWFPNKPVPDDDSLKWISDVSEWIDETTMSAEDGYFLCNAAKEAGWEEGNVLLWIYQKAGELLKKRKV